MNKLMITLKHFIIYACAILCGTIVGHYSPLKAEAFAALFAGSLVVGMGLCLGVTLCVLILDLIKTHSKK